jgi:hypothetical protein
VDQVLQGRVSVESFDRAVTSADMMPTLLKKVARRLGPRGLMPNARSTQGLGVRFDMRTVDPTIAFFLKSGTGRMTKMTTRKRNRRLRKKKQLSIVVGTKRGLTI